MNILISLLSVTILFFFLLFLRNFTSCSEYFSKKDENAQFSSFSIQTSKEDRKGVIVDNSEGLHDDIVEYVNANFPLIFKKRRFLLSIKEKNKQLIDEFNRYASEIETQRAIDIFEKKIISLKAKNKEIEKNIISLNIEIEKLYAMSGKNDALEKVALNVLSQLDNLIKTNQDTILTIEKSKE